MITLASAFVASFQIMLQASNIATPAPARDVQTACRGVPTAEWTAGSLTNPQNVRAVQEVRPETPVSETETVVQRWGARILLGAQPGMTAEWLQRVAECHMAQVATSANLELTQSPLDVKGALVAVQSVGDGFAVDVTSRDPKVGREIFARARALAPQAASGR